MTTCEQRGLCSEQRGLCSEQRGLCREQRGLCREQRLVEASLDQRPVGGERCEDTVLS